jgi:hypothetical protein
VLETSHSPQSAAPMPLPAGPDEALRALTAETLAPLTASIDREGVYPEGFLREAGRLGAFNRHLPSQSPDRGMDLPGPFGQWKRSPRSA